MWSCAGPAHRENQEKIDQVEAEQGAGLSSDEYSETIGATDFYEGGGIWPTTGGIDAAITKREVVDLAEIYDQAIRAVDCLFEPPPTTREPGHVPGNHGHGREVGVGISNFRSIKK